MQQGILWIVVVVLVVVAIAFAMVAIREAGVEEVIERAGRGIFRVLPTPPRMGENPPAPIVPPGAMDALAPTPAPEPSFPKE